jgi:tRNA A-37 threonylcarbamoyl transferase component Bud32
MSASPADLPARIGRYQVMERIGRGGMAEVFLARAVGPGGIAKSLCIKRMLPDLLLTQRALERFSEEARTVLALQHANIVPVFDFGRDGQDLYLAMEWIDGCDLAALLAWTRARGTLLPPQVAAHVTLEVARALAYAHAPGGGRAGLLHSDVTPRNVLLSRQGEVRLTDFGIARALGGGAARAGTPAYMAPEAARGEPIDERADLYSLGLMFGEMLSGRRLRESNELAAAGAPAELPGLGGVPAPFAEVARRLLAEPREARFASASQVVTALSAPLAAALVHGDEPPAPALAALVTLAAPAGVRLGAPADQPATSAPPTIDFQAIRTQPRRSPGRRAAVLAALGVAIVTAGAVAVSGRRPSEVKRAPAPLALNPRAASPARPSPGAPTPPTLAPAPTPAARQRPARGARLKITTPGSWVAVYLDGRKLGEGPGLFEIPAGKHELRVANEPLGFARREAINAAPGTTLELTFHTRE